MIWEQWLTDLERLPSDAAEWDAENVAAFVEAVGLLAQDKRRDREAGRQKLQQAIDALRRERAAPLRYNKVVCDGWSAELCPLAEAATLLERVGAFDAILKRHEELLGINPQSREDRNSLNESLNSLESEILAAHASLHAQLTVGSPAPAPHTPDEPTEDQTPIPTQTAPEPQPTHEPEPTQEPAPVLERQPAQSGVTPPAAELSSTHESAEPVHLAADEVQPAEQSEAEPPESEAETPEAHAPVAALPATEPAAEPEVEKVQAAPTTEAQPPQPRHQVEHELKTEARPAPQPEPPPARRSVYEGGNGNKGVAAVVRARVADNSAPPASQKPAKPEPKIELSLAVLNPPRKVAQYLRAHDEPEAWDAFLWSLIAAGDLSAAYWLARSLKANGAAATVPDWLLAAVQGAQWVRSDADPLAMDLLNIAAEPEHQIGSSAPDVQKILGLSASLLSVLIAPNCGLDSWFQVPACCPSAASLIEAINNFVGFGIALRPDDVALVSGMAQNEAAIVEAARQLKDWLDEAPNRWVKGVGGVWYYMVKPTSAFARALHPAAENRRGEVESVRKALADWQDHAFLLRQINNANVATSKGPPKQLGGDLRSNIERDLLKACSFASRWCELVGRRQELREKYEAEAEGWQSEMVETLRREIGPALSQVEAELSNVEKSPQMLAAAACLRRSLAQLREALRIEGAAAGGEVDWALPPVVFKHGANDLDAALSRRLWLLPEVAREDGPMTEESLRPVAAALRDSYAEGRTIREAFDQWLAREDYRFADRLAEELPDEETRAAYARRYTDALIEARQSLQDELHETIDAVERALLDGAISDERAQFLSITESITPDKIFNFAPERAKLEDVHYELASARDRYLAQLREHWARVEALLPTHTGLPAENREKIRDFIQSALDKGEIRVVDECLARVKVIVETKEYAKELTLEKLGWVAPAPARNVLREFLNAARNIDEWLHHNSALGGDRLNTVPEEIVQGNAPFGVAAPKPQNREKVAQAVTAWLKLKRQGKQMPWDAIAPQIALILPLLGFELVRHAGAAPVKVVESQPEWLYAHAVLSSGDQAKPLPQFAVEPNLTAPKVEGNYDVVCVWGKPSAAKLGSILTGLELGKRSVIVLYFGPLTPTERNSMASMTREKKEIALAMLDETLMLFLTGEEDPLPVFLRCALPFSTVMPYTPRLHGDVPKEMFFGRQDKIDDLWKETGSCLVYGGRQLGKTALLRNLMRQHHRPKQQQYVWFVSMDTEFGPHVGKGTDNLWRILRDWFKADGLLSKQISTDAPDQIIGYIRTAMNGAPNARILAIFDEADDFLDADAADQFKVVKELREMMSATDRRFKVIFAGNRKVMRFHHIPNQPLLHFGEQILIGPLESEPAQQLVREPFEALGFEFSDDSLALRILSHTNYHAGLIQFFCYELLKRVYERTGNSAPPHKIYPSDIEAVYHNKETRDAISERFDMTLKLKTEYQVIASIIIADQMAAKDGYGQHYSATDLLELAQERWPQGFAETSVDEMYVQLDEMCGLGVLVRDREGYFRLRSPNLVGMMGTREDIRGRLAQLAKTVPEPKYDMDSHHMWLDATPGRYSPLTYAQDRMLNKHRTGVGLVFASEALGAAALPEVFARFIPSDAPEGGPNACVEIPPAVNEAAAMKSWLDDFLAVREEGIQPTAFRRYVVYQRVDPGATHVHELVKAAADFCRDHPKESRVLRVIFLLDPQATWRWLSLPYESRKATEDRLDIATYPRLWNVTGVRQRLSQLNMLFSDDVCKQVLQATGGWPLLLDKLFAECVRLEHQEDPRPCIPEFVRQLGSPDSDLRRRFRGALGVEEGTAPWKVLKFIEEDSISKSEDILPDFLADFVSLSKEECSQAIEYLQRMSCLEVTPPMVRIEPTARRVLFSS